MIKRIETCRIAKNENLISVLSLGDQALTGVFPQSADVDVTVGPLEIVWNPDSGLLQLAHVYEPEEMYGDNYGYRSGLNQSMVRHLDNKIHTLERLYDVKPGDTVLDVGSNDATSLKAYATPSLNRIGIDPTGAKFREYYPDDIKLVPDFFNKANFDKVSTSRAKVITSIAMFYDLEDPIDFARDIASALDPDGVWHFEQSYMPAMLRLNSYDTICHEHVEYYSLGAIEYILRAADMKILDVQMNDINGASFAVTATHAASSRQPNRAVVDWLLEQEDRAGLMTVEPYRAFESRVFRHREDLRRLLQALRDDGKRVMGYGASTKGNVVLQFCGIDATLVEAIVEVNPDKYGCVTPGTHIPIVSEEEANRMQPDYYLVLPWHFRAGILQREAAFRDRGGKFIFPFPEIEIV
jgi:C-methyltransferase C-terminal domain/Putative zinc binding domain/Methyltransferase domain